MLTASVSDLADAGIPGLEVDFEIVGGPGDDDAGTSGNTPTTPDMSCVTAGGGPVTRLLRRFTLGSGPLKRRSDRVQVLGRVALLLSVVLAPPVAVAVTTASPSATGPCP